MKRRPSRDDIRFDAGKMFAGIESSYDRVAAEYAAEFADELDRKPFDREVLDRFAAEMRGKGTVCDLGCGPGHVARCLKDRGLDVRGVDLSAEMVRQAQTLHPDIPFERGDMLDLKLRDLAGIVCFYTIIHLDRADVPRALGQMRGALQPGGRVLLSFHGGEGTLHREQWYGKEVSVDVSLFSKEEMERYLADAGFIDIEILDRAPYEFEYQTRRLYAFARS